MDRIKIAHVKLSPRTSRGQALADAMLQARLLFLDKHGRQPSFGPKTSVAATWDDGGWLHFDLMELETYEDIPGSNTQCVPSGTACADHDGNRVAQAQELP